MSELHMKKGVAKLYKTPNIYTIQRKFHRQLNLNSFTGEFCVPPKLAEFYFNLLFVSNRFSSSITLKCAC